MENWVLWAEERIALWGKTEMKKLWAWVSHTAKARSKARRWKRDQGKLYVLSRATSSALGFLSSHDTGSHPYVCKAGIWGTSVWRNCLVKTKELQILTSEEPKQRGQISHTSQCIALPHPWLLVAFSCLTLKHVQKPNEEHTFEASSTVKYRDQTWQTGEKNPEKTDNVEIKHFKTP